MSPQKRRLEDLYVVGKFITFDDGKGDPVRVWMRKLNPIEAAKAGRQANAVRSKMRAAMSDIESDYYLEALGEVLDFGDDLERLVDWLSMEDSAEAIIHAEAQLAEEEEWSKDDYLQGLRDAWEGGLSDAWLVDQADPEASRVFTELKRFDDAASANATAVIESIKASFRREDIATLRTEVVKAMLKYRASSAWVDEYHRCEIWLGTFEEDKKTQYWSDRATIDKLSIEVLTQLLSEYTELSVDVTEGKGSEETPASSTSSEPQAAGETDDSSGLAAVSQ